ncbi:hypothetical protein NSS64_32420 [Paenibacillus sp. FSL H8-0122]|uniref:hypothetical protein n=1 Tax=Paenibacillus sp. FSL H8-0122 TaxID=2954510 RepID=UPI0030F6D4B1
MRKMCSVPTCQLDATTTWATVPVCQYCRDIIMQEQLEYYRGKLQEHERCRYIRIRHMTPLWSILKRELAYG